VRRAQREIAVAERMAFGSPLKTSERVDAPAALFGPLREAQDVAGKTRTKEKGAYVGRKQV
jgi:hypothetical protein